MWVLYQKKIESLLFMDCCDAVFQNFLKAPYVGSATSLLFTDSDSQTLILRELPLFVKGK